MRSSIVLLMLVQCLSLSCQTSFFGSLKPGPYKVGWKTISIHDANRQYANSPRPVLISVWYPTGENEGQHIQFEDYLFAHARRLNPQQLSTNAQDSVRRSFIDFIKTRGASEEDLKVLLKTPAFAQTAPQPMSGELPLIITLQGGGRPAYTNFILNEFLASQGFVVASIADIYHSPDREQNNAALNAIALSKDLSLTVESLREEFRIKNKIGAIGFSRAGEAIIHFESEHRQLSAFVALDAQPGQRLVESFLQSSGHINIPILAFFSNHQNRVSLSQAKADSLAFTFLPKTETTIIRMMELNHGNLTSAGMIAANMVEGYNRWPLIGDVKRGYEVICELVSQFFLEHLTDQENLLDLSQRISEMNLPAGFLVTHKN